MLLALWSDPAHADPYRQWRTVVTPHFRVTYHGGLEAVAQRAAAIAEHAYAILNERLDHRPSEVVEILLTDDSESANGSASAVPYNAIRLFVTAPDDMSPLGEHDDWLAELLLHEYTHVVHVDNVSGLPALLNKVLGKTAVPNQAQPRWILEGLAVAMETDHTSGGRLRSTQFDMFLRADVLEGRFAGLDQISNPPRRWPSGNLWYLYGAGFVAYIQELYGPGVFAAVADDYGAQVAPWGVNRSIRRVTGRTYEELYEGWQRSLERRYREQAARINERGLRAGRRLTRRGLNAGGALVTGPCGTLGKPSVIYYREDGSTPGGLYEVALDGSTPHGKLRARTNSKTASFAPDCSLVFDDIAISRRRYAFSDLFRLAPGQSEPSNSLHERQRLTVGLRARHPNVSPDGRRVTYVTNDRGTSTLRIAELGPDFELRNSRALVPSGRFEQAYTPRFSADGRKVAYSAWTTGGYRDIRIVDVETGVFQELFHDRALDQHPRFSRDGRLLYFTSDRSGVANIYAFDLVAKKLWQVTNVVNGAYFPELSADEKTLIYLGYTSSGWDLFSMRNDPALWLEPEAYTEERAERSDRVASTRYPVEPYRALPSLRPHNYEVEYGPGSFGDTLTISTSGSDIAGLHGIAASIGVDTQRADPQVSLAYAYGGLPFGFGIEAFRSASPRNDYEYSERRPPIVEHLTGLTSSLSYGLPRPFESENIYLSYTVAEFSQRLPLGLPDPYAPLPTEPHSGLLGIVTLGYGFSNAEGSTYGISPERGFSLSLSSDFADPALGSEHTLIAFSGVLTSYVAVPWLDHHVLALALSAGTSTGSYPRGGLYSIGGYSDLPILDAYTSDVRQGPLRLRGYEPGQFAGSDYNLINLEYRFPLLYADRGISTLPAFLRTVSGNLFADYGAAYNELELEHPLRPFRLGIGAELWLDLVLGYYASGNIRIGVARGMSAEAPPGLQTYGVVSAAF